MCAYAHKSMIWQHKLEHDRNSMNWGRKAQATRGERQDGYETGSRSLTQLEMFRVQCDGSDAELDAGCPTHQPSNIQTQKRTKT